MSATYFQKILSKTPSLSVVSDPRNVLREKQGRLIRQNLGLKRRGVTQLTKTKV